MLYVGTYDEEASEAVRRAVIERGLSSHMNNTKWLQLCTAVAEELPFPPPYKAKLVLEDDPDVDVTSIGYYFGDWATTPEASMGIYIEWLKVNPRIYIRIGQLAPPRLEDCSASFSSILKRLRIPYTEENGIFTIYGHSNGTVFATLDKAR